MTRIKQSVGTLSGLLLSIPVLWSTPALANEAEELLRTMQSAVHSLSYSGKLVFARGNELAEYKIEHQSGQGNSSSETVIKLNKGDAENAGEQQFSLINSSSLRLPDQQAYRIDLGGDAQIANHPCKVVVVRPKDKMRYLHRYCISPETGMLLRYSVMNRQQQLLEQFMFTQLSVDNNYQQQNMLMQQRPVNSGVANLPESWDFSALPRGFKVKQVNELPGKANAYQIILFDGLTFVSVFIEPGNVQVARQKQLPASGATNIVTQKTASHTVTLVGEVPRETLLAIQNGLRHIAP